MSKYVSFETVFTNGKALMDALNAIGMTGIQNHIDKPVQMNDYFGKPSNRYADILVPKSGTKGAYTALGFFRNTKGQYEAVVDDMDLRRYNKDWNNNLKVEYSEAETKAKLKAEGYVLVNTGINKLNGNRKYEYHQI